MSEETVFSIRLAGYTLQLLKPPPEGRDELDFVIGKQFPSTRLSKSQPYQEGFKVSYKLRDDKGITVTLSGKSKHGNPVDFANEDFTAVSSDPTILAVTKDATGKITIEPVGPLGSAQVQVSLTNVLVGTPPAPLSGHFDVEVVAGAAASIAFNTGDTFDLPDPPIPAPPAPPDPIHTS